MAPTFDSPQRSTRFTTNLVLAPRPGQTSTPKLGDEPVGAARTPQAVPSLPLSHPLNPHTRTHTLSLACRLRSYISARRAARPTRLASRSSGSRPSTHSMASTSVIGSSARNTALSSRKLGAGGVGCGWDVCVGVGVGGYCVCGVGCGVGADGRRGWHRKLEPSGVGCGVLWGWGCGGGDNCRGLAHCRTVIHSAGQLLAAPEGAPAWAAPRSQQRCLLPLSAPSAACTCAGARHATPLRVPRCERGAALTCTT